MDRVNGANWIDIGGGKRGFRSQDAGSGLSGTEVTPLFLNALQEELLYIIQQNGLDPDPNDWTQVHQAIELMISASIDPNLNFFASPIFPHIATSANTLAITDNANGTITVDAGQGWMRRGVFQYLTNNFAAGDRTFAHVLNKTYHLRWHAPGTGDATPAATYPHGRIVLKDLANVGYNAGALAETNAAFDTTFDDMLIARVVTDGANVPTITSLFNHMTPIDSVNHNAPDYFIDNIGGVKTNTITINWSRTPIVARGFAKRSFHEGHIPGGTWDNDWEAEEITLTRYALVYELTCDRTESAPNVDFTFNAL